MVARVGYADHIFITQVFFKNRILYVKKTYKGFYLLPLKGEQWVDGWREGEGGMEQGVGMGSKNVKGCGFINILIF